MPGPDSVRDKSLKAFVTGLQDSYNDALFSDLIVKCQDMERRVHKIVICKHSKWFAKACTGDFKERKSKTIELHEDDPEIIDTMLRYCYTFEVDAGGSYLRAVKIFAAAEKYIMEPLQRAAAAEFARLFRPSLWESLASEADVSVAQHAAAIAEAYTTSSDPAKVLRKAILTCVTSKPVDLERDIMGSSGYRMIAKSHPEFSVDLAMRLAQTGPVLETVRVRVSCPHRHWDSVALKHVLCEPEWEKGEIRSTCEHCPPGHAVFVTASEGGGASGQNAGGWGGGGW